MQKLIRKIYISIIIFMILLTGTVFAANLETIEPQYTEEYKQWLELPDDQRKKIVEPTKYVFNETLSNEEAIYTNKNITLNTLNEVLRASVFSTNKKFSLNDYIGNNIIIKDQNPTNSCWAFATLSSLETNLALKNYTNKVPEKLYDYSEKHMVYSMTNSFLNGQVNYKGWNKEASQGGTFIMSTAYLTNGSGAINENDMPFDKKEDKIDISQIQNKTVQTTVNDIRYFNQMYCLKDSVIDTKGNTIDQSNLATLKQEMKEHISTNGSIYAGIYMTKSIAGDKYLKYNTGAMYCPMNNFENIQVEIEKKNSGDSNAVYINHGISIIGWDDEYPKENFAITPNNNGAWIIRNSYGTQNVTTFQELKESIIKENGHFIQEEFDDMLLVLENMNYIIDRENETVSLPIGKDGYFYISYEDAYIYTNLIGIESANDTKTYDNIYQYDELGGESAIALEISKTKDIYLANVFKRNTTSKEKLKSIGFQDLQGGTFEVYVNPNGTDKSMSSLQKVELTTGNDITLTSGYHTINLKNPIELTGDSFVIAIAMKHDDTNYKFYTYEDPKQNPNIKITNANESFITMEGFSKDADWIDIGNSADTEVYRGNLCIKGITEVENNGTTPSTPEPDNTNVTNSNYNSAKASITDIKINSKGKDTKFSYTIKIEGIKVNKLCDKYEHYFYLSSNSNAKNIKNSKWSKAASFKKQSNGTYTLTLKITDLKQIADVKDDHTAYIYIKEVAQSGGKTTTTLSKAIEVKINTDSIKNNSQGTNTKQKKSEKKDTTVAKSILPKTGFGTIILAIVVISSVAVIVYVKCKQYKDIK
ncbi:MAG: hypothetical protein HFJ17_03815 [Clostridia bacterium]|nr:hypothetical protein [Clostridia bacterium]